MIITFNTVVTETAREILGKHRQKKKLWVTAGILDLCDRRWELRKKRFEPEGFEKYKGVSNIIKRCVKKGKKWIGEQCSEIEENLRKNNSKRAYQPRLDHCETRNSYYCPKIVQENASQKNKRYWTDGQNTALGCTITRPMEIHQYWTVPRQTQRMTIPFFAKKWRLQYNHWWKGSQLESTISQQNWSKQVERM